MNDAIDFSTVQILNSPDVRGYAVTSTITSLGLFPDHLHLQHTKEGQWRPAMIDSAQQEATLWIFLRINGQWFGAGVERIRPGQVDKPENPPSHERDDWFYDPSRWHEMTGHQPAAGELVGFCVVAGDSRGLGQQTDQERSAIVLVDFPTDEGKSYPPFASLERAPGPTPEPTPTPSDEEPLWAQALVDAIDSAHAGIVELQTEIRALNAKLESVVAHGVKIHL